MFDPLPEPETRSALSVDSRDIGRRDLLARAVAESHEVNKIPEVFSPIADQAIPDRLCRKDLTTLPLTLLLVERDCLVQLAHRVVDGFDGCSFVAAEIGRSLL